VQALGARASLFVDADPALPAQASTVGSDRIELYTGPFGASYGTATGQNELDKLRRTALAAHSLRRANGSPALGVNAGHDLALPNLPAFQLAVSEVDEVSIGHAITADALLVGFPEAVRRYKRALDGQ
jgi:pyridoxine 5-phosphate synthase